jgi:hypothetical protein
MLSDPGGLALRLGAPFGSNQYQIGLRRGANPRRSHGECCGRGRLATSVPVCSETHRARVSPLLIIDAFAGVYEVIAGVALIIAGAAMLYDGAISTIWGAVMILLGVVVLILDMLGII